MINKTNKAMTVQDLKENREEIISIIKEEGNESMIKEIMEAMVKCLDFAESNDIYDYTTFILSMNTKWTEKQVSNPLWGNGAKYATQAEYQRSCMGSKWN